MSIENDQRFSNLHPSERDAIMAFVVPERRSRYLERMADPEKRASQLDRLNHCRDLREQYASTVLKGESVEDVLKSLGAPSKCHVISGHDAIDGMDLPLGEAIAETQAGGWGTLLVCIPDRLVYYYDELGEREFILERK